MQDEKQYILGTEAAELHRLGVQHQVWSTEANQAWANAGFQEGMTLLDLGCGPGFCTQELAYIAGSKGKVVAVDLSPNYINFLKQIASQHQLSIESVCSDFYDMDMGQDRFDGVYTRWALAWLPGVEPIVDKVVASMKVGATWAIQEYYDWSLLQFSPHMPELYDATRAILKSFADMGGNIDIGMRIAPLLSQKGMEIVSTRPMTKLCRSHEHQWQWPKTFLEIYMPKLIPNGYISEAHCQAALEQLKELERIPGATIQCPLMIEVIARKLK